MTPEAFEFIQTGDGTKTIMLGQGPVQEAMHHLDGALEETIYINTPVLQGAFQACENPRFLVVGLGLGFIEIFIAAWAVKVGRMPAVIETCEVVPELKDHFKNWILGLPLPKVFFESYQDTTSRFASRMDVSKEEIANCLKKLWDFGRIKFSDSVLELSNLEMNMNGIFFDPFSRKASPEIWDEVFLGRFLSHVSDRRQCFFGTYSSRGTLKTALKAEGFTVLKRPGFSGKRDCLFAKRET